MQVLHYGLGPIGAEVARLVASRPEYYPVAAVDVNPNLVGRRLSEVLDTPDIGDVVIADGLPQTPGADVAVHCTGSDLRKVGSQIVELVERGMNVVSTCEELSFPWLENREEAEAIDAAAREEGVTVVGTGVNPGFAMDFLGLVAAASLRSVNYLQIHRVQDAATRRLPLQRKVGAGMDPETFYRLAKQNDIGHVGLRQSAMLLAHSLGWEIAEYEESLDPVLADRPMVFNEGEIQEGQVAGIRHSVIATVEGRKAVELLLEMAIGLDRPRDELVVDGDPNLHLQIPGGLPGDSATAAIVVNSLSNVAKAQPGLLTVADLPPPRSSGRRGSS